MGLATHVFVWLLCVVLNGELVPRVRLGHRGPFGRETSTLSSRFSRRADGARARTRASGMPGARVAVALGER